MARHRLAVAGVIMFIPIITIPFGPWPFAREIIDADRISDAAFGQRG